MPIEFPPPCCTKCLKAQEAARAEIERLTAYIEHHQAVEADQQRAIERLQAKTEAARQYIDAIEAVVDRAAGDRSYDGDLIDDIRDIIDGKVKTEAKS